MIATCNEDAMPVGIRSLVEPSAGYQRATVAAAGFCMQLALGATYGWSVLLNPLQSHFSATQAEVNFTFTITLAVLGITAGFGGRLMQAIGARATATVAGVLYGSGVFLSGFAPGLAEFYLTYGVLSGAGLGLGYIVPLAVLIRWFPDKRGFITGLAVTGFGLGALITSPVAVELLRSHGVQYTLMFFGAVNLAVIVTAAQFLRSAPDDFVPNGWKPSVIGISTFNKEVSFSEALRSRHWYLLWGILAFNVTAGAALISVASPLAQEFAGVGPAAGAVVVCVIAAFNGLGRLVWGALSDRIGRPATFLALFILQAGAFLTLGGTDRFAMLLFPIAIVALCYGGGFGTMPAFTADTFGPKNSGPIYGVMLTAWSAGAIAGPLLIASVPYRTAVFSIAGMCVVATVLPITFQSPRKHLLGSTANT
jgi:OFA family oxalate/formate antiporter-like MFS transporter